jgi:hypothetical protein
MRRISAAALGAWLLIGALGCDPQNDAASNPGAAPTGPRSAASRAALAAKSPTAKNLISNASDSPGAVPSASGLKGRQMFDGDSRGTSPFSFFGGNAVPVSRPNTYSGTYSKFSPPKDLNTAPPPAPGFFSGSQSAVVAAVRALGGDVATGLKIAASAVRDGVSVPIALALAKAESGIGTNNSVSSKGAIGPMQVMPTTAAEMGYHLRPGDNDLSITAGTDYMKRYLKARCGNNVACYARGYNGGPGVANGGRIRKETVNYIPVVQNAFSTILPFFSSI